MVMLKFSLQCDDFWELIYVLYDIVYIGPLDDNVLTLFILHSLSGH